MANAVRLHAPVDWEPGWTGRADRSTLPQGSRYPDSCLWCPRTDPHILTERRLHVYLWKRVTRASEPRHAGKTVDTPQSEGEKGGVAGGHRRSYPTVCLCNKHAGYLFKRRGRQSKPFLCGTVRRGSAETCATEALRLGSSADSGA